LIHILVVPLTYAIRNQYSSSNGVSGIGCGLRTEIRFPEGTEAARHPGARHDSPEWFRKWHIYSLQFETGNVISGGMLRNDRHPIDQVWQAWPQRARARFTDEQMKAWVARRNRKEMLDQNGRYELPDQYQPNIDADHYFMDYQFGSQLRCEYEEQRMVDSVTKTFADAQAIVRNAFWFFPSRFFHILAQSQKKSADVTVNTQTGQLERNDTIASSLSRSAF